MMYRVLCWSRIIVPSSSTCTWRLNQFHPGVEDIGRIRAIMLIVLGSVAAHMWELGIAKEHGEA
jgi:hypothetical protein